MELAGSSQLHSCVKVENDTAAVAHEIQIRDAAESLENASLLIAVAESATAAGTARHPLALESAHDHIGDKLEAEDLAGVSLAEHIGELLALVDRCIVRIFIVNGEAHSLLPGRIGICKKHTDENTAGHTALVARIVAIRLAVNAHVNAEELAHGLGERMNPRAALVCDMDEHLVKEDIVDVADGESLCHRLDELDCGERVKEREGLGQGGQEERNHLARLRGVKIRIEETEDVFVGHHAHRAEENKDGNRLADIGDGDDEGIRLSHPVEADRLDLACNRREAHQISVGGNLRITGLLLGIQGVERLLLAGDENLLCARDDEIAALVVVALAGLCQECGGLAVENTIARVEHHRNLKQGKALKDAAGLLIRCAGGGAFGQNADLHVDVGDDGGGIGEATEAGFVGKEEAGSLGESKSGAADFNLSA